MIDPEEEKRRKAQAPTAQEVYGPAYRGIAGALSGARQPHQHRRRPRRRFIAAYRCKGLPMGHAEEQSGQSPHLQRAFRRKE